MYVMSVCRECVVCVYVVCGVGMRCVCVCVCMWYGDKGYGYVWYVGGVMCAYYVG